MNHLIVGYGEVGQGLHKVFKKAFITDLNYKKSTWEGTEIDVVHICIPYTENFLETVKFYKQFSRLIIVHSSVPLGTCDKLGVVHSPIRGVHPNIDKGIRTFVKYFGGRKSRTAAGVFRWVGIKTKTYRYARTTEALKLWDTTQYGKLIMMEKEIHAWCKKNKVNFDDVYTHANQTYNQGYLKLNRPEVVRPYLKHRNGPIGGHCVLPNAKLLGVQL